MFFDVVVQDFDVNVYFRLLLKSAGNGKVLYTENANQEDDKNEATRPKSSIQVQEASDGDGETNDDGK